MPTLIVNHTYSLSDVLDRVRDTGGDASELRLEIPPGAALFLTAAEFRSLKEVADRQHLKVTIGTSDPLRLQLARMLGLPTSANETPAAPRLARQPAPPPATPPSKTTTPAAPSDRRAPSHPASSGSTPVKTAPTAPASAARIPPTQSPASTAPASRPTSTPSPTIAPPPPPPARAATATTASVGPPPNRVPSAPSGANPLAPNGATQGCPPTATPPDKDGYQRRQPAASIPSLNRPPPEPASPVPSPNDGGSLTRTIDLNTDDSDTGDAASTTWYEHLRSRSRRAWILIGVVVIAVVLVGAFLFVPHATIRLELARQPLATSLVLAASGTGDVPADADLIAQTTPRTVDLTIERSVPTTGTRTEPDATAAGTVLLSNPNPEEVTIEAGTVVLTEAGTEFAFVDAVTVPPGDSANGQYGSARATVRAKEAGAAANTGVGELGGRLDSGVYFSNREAEIDGGSDKTIQVVAPEDLETARAAAEATITDGTTDAYAGSLPDGVIAIPASAQLGDGTETFSHQPGEDATELSVTLMRTVTVLTIDRAAMLDPARTIASERLIASVPAGYELDPDTIELSDPVLIDDAAADDRYRIDATANARAVLSEEEQAALVSELAGDDPEAAEEVLSDIPDVVDSRIDYSPGWLPKRIPANPGRIEIVAE